jgi:plasmid maintenance system killer protein
MIRSFRDAATARLFDEEDVPRFRAIERQARRKLLLMDGAGALNDCEHLPATGSKPLKATAVDNIRSASTINGEYVLRGGTAARMMSKSWTITSLLRTTR